MSIATKNGLLALLVALGLAFAIPASAQNGKDEPFKGKLFPPNVILQHKDQLNLTKQQFTAIRAAVVEVQSGVAEHEWDMAEAYQALMAELDHATIDEARVMEHAEAALRAENEVKKKQISMLITLRNLLTDEQVAYLRSMTE
ncbi:MAG: hypothetical protein AAFN50_11720 [Pseudomonadota bacterium]